MCFSVLIIHLFYSIVANTVAKAGLTSHEVNLYFSNKKGTTLFSLQVGASFLTHWRYASTPSTPRTLFLDSQLGVFLGQSLEIYGVYGKNVTPKKAQIIGAGLKISIFDFLKPRSSITDIYRASFWLIGDVVHYSTVNEFKTSVHYRYTIRYGAGLKWNLGNKQNSFYLDTTLLGMNVINRLLIPLIAIGKNF